MIALDADNPFWRFSLKVYASPGVPAECLALQERLGIDVNVLLFAVFLGARRGVTLERAELSHIAGAVASWSGDVVKPLRAIRQRLKLKDEIADPSVQALRKRVADVELLSEQIEQAMLYRLADGFGPAGKGGADAARTNVATLLAMHGADASAFPLDALFAACEPESG